MSTQKPLWHGYKWEMLALLAMAFFLNQADRAIYGVVLPHITVDLQLTEAQAGLVATVLFLTMAVLMPFAGLAGDRLPKARLITFCLLFWSVATLFTGLVGGVVGLVVFRSLLTGGGEAFYTPAAYALMAKYHTTTRSIAMSAHQAAFYVGVMTSGFIGGAIAEAWGWRNAFYIYGGCGILLGIVFMFRLRDTQNSGTQDSGTGCQPVSPESDTGILPVSPSSTGILPVCSSNTGVPPVIPSSPEHRQDADVTQSHGQDARVTQSHGQDARVTQSHWQDARATQSQSHGLAARATAKTTAEAAPTFWQSLSLFFRVPSALLFTCGCIGINCVHTAHVVLAPKLLLEKFPSLSLTLAGGYAMFFHYLAAFVGIIAGGALSDYFVRRRPTVRLELQIVAMTLGAPAIVWMGLAPSLVSVCVAMSLFGLLRGLYESNTQASLFDVIPPRFRATSWAVMAMLMLVPSSLMPWLLGMMKDHLPEHGYSYGFAATGVFWVLGAIALLVARLRTFHRDRVELS